MNLFELVLKQMRQRSLSTWLTLFSVMLGVALAVATMIVRRDAGQLFGQTDYGYDVLVGAKGSPLQLVLNTVYHIDKSPGNVPYSLYQSLIASPLYRPLVRIAVPYVVGDSYKNHRIVGTLPKLFGLDDDGKPLPPEKVLEVRPDQTYQMAAGHVFAADKFEAIIGSDITAETGLKLGDQFQATHGLPAPGETPDIHKPKWTVVGVLAPTHTANDHVVFIPMISFYTIAEHDVGLVAQKALRDGTDPNAAIQALKLSTPPTPGAKDDDDDVEHFTLDADGHIKLQISTDVWGLSAILVKARSPVDALTLIYNISNGPDANAVNPAGIMRDFFAGFLKGPTLVLLVVSLLVTIVAGVGILVSIYNSVAARAREIAVLRALGATRAKIMALICVEAGFIGLAGGLLGLLAGHALAAAGSVYFNQLLGEGINWFAIGPEEGIYLCIVVALAVLAGLVPALKAYRTPVATNL
jgi:putative ABC transport system permease protein